jgi:hypothetical protein
VFAKLQSSISRKFCCSRVGTFLGKVCDKNPVSGLPVLFTKD